MKENQTILVIDDVVDNLNIVANILIPKSYNVILLQSGKDILKTVHKVKPDLILLDVMMPDTDGYEVCKTLKAKPEVSDIPVIFLTALTDKKNLIRGFEVGAVDYITKPFNDTELIIRVNTHLKLRETTEILKRKNDKLLASIKYAKIIQNAIMPSSEALKYFLPEHFIIFKPRDIVSGDFYWVKQYKNNLYISVADCTGHGVPGAFISLLGIAYLNEIIFSFKEEEELPANKILDILRARVIKMLSHEGHEQHIKDGMDLALCVINLENKTMNYAGANRPLFIIRKDKQSLEYKLLHYKPDNLPIAFYRKTKFFSNNTIKLETGDLIYLFTDGFIDQFGGKSNRKFLLKNFKDLLLNNCDKPLNEQKEIIEDTFNNWKSTNNQIDDILILGFKIFESYGDIEFF